jgi:hypothetical protein
MDNKFFNKVRWRFCLQQQFTTASKIPWKDAETLSETYSASIIIITLSAGIITSTHFEITQQ